MLNALVHAELNYRAGSACPGGLTKALCVVALSHQWVMASVTESGGQIR